jgi:hypothetical protein
MSTSDFSSATSCNTSPIASYSSPLSSKSSAPLARIPIKAFTMNYYLKITQDRCLEADWK